MSDRRPAFSIVVPVYNVAEYLGACLDSILDQSFADFEVLLIDDASTDDSHAVAARYAQRDPRVSVTRLPANVGLGLARNAGMDLARAPYVLFVDSDDLLAPHALPAIAARIADGGEPDVVMFGYARSYPDGRVVTDERTALLAPPRRRSADERQTLLAIIPSAWNKAYRRGFLTERGFRFRAGMYEDVPWSYPILMAADVLVTLDRVCYLYRQRRATNLLSSSGLVHLDLITQYDRVFAYLDAHPELESWRRPMVDRIAWHIPTVLETTARIPPADRRAFFDAASAAMHRHRPAGYLPAGRLGLKVLLLERGGYRVFRAAQLANRVRRALRERRRHT